MLALNKRCEFCAVGTCLKLCKEILRNPSSRNLGVNEMLRMIRSPYALGRNA